MSTEPLSAHGRRAFLRTMARGAVATAAAPSALLAASRTPRLRPGLVPDEPYWEVVKAQFPLRPGIVPMNAANLCPSPFPVSEAVSAWTREVDGDVSFQNRAKFAELHTAALEALARYVGADPDEVVITRNTTEGNNTVVSGIELRPGDQVVLWDQNHPSNDLAWEVRARREGFEVVRVSTPESPTSSASLLEPFLAALGPRTRVLSFSHVSNGTGVALPAAELCAAARERGIFTLIDGAQTFGAQALDLHALGCDSFTASAHKWLMGPKEAGLLYVRRARQPELWPSMVGVGWREDSGATRRLGTHGQRDDACVSAVIPAVDFHRTIGPERVETRVRELATALMEGIRARVPAVSFRTPADPELRLGVVVMALPGVESGAGFERLYRENGIAGAPTGGLRLCPHVYNTMADIERAVEAVARLG